jgi:hypothetical protein
MVAYNAATIPLELLDMVMYVGMHFSEQKNGIKNETIGLTRSRDLTACPIRAAIRCVRHLREHLLPPTTLLFIYCQHNSEHRITD